MSRPVKRADFFGEYSYPSFVRAKTWASAWRMARNYKASLAMRKVYRVCMRDAALDAVKMARREAAKEAA